MHCVHGPTGHLLDKSLCQWCRFNEIRYFIMVSTPTEGRGCYHHLAGFPVKLHCARYEREPGTDD